MANYQADNFIKYIKLLFLSRHLVSIYFSGLKIVFFDLPCTDWDNQANPEPPDRSISTNSTKSDQVRPHSRMS